MQNLTFNFPDTKSKFHLGINKTIRVRNDQTLHVLPPSLGLFPQYFYDNKRIVPVGEDEALWFSFSNSNYNVPVAIKILAGGINAITGEKEEGENCTILRNSGEDAAQNYMVAPGQLWLDGFKTDDGKVRQFIAVAMGQGRSVEEKLDGTEKGGIQVIVIPIKKEIYETNEAKRRAEEERMRQEEEENAYYYSDYSFDQPVYRGLGNFDLVAEAPVSSLKQMGLGAGGIIKQDIHESHFAPADFDRSKAQYIEFSMVDANEFARLMQLPEPPRQPSHDKYTNAGGLWFDYVSKEKAVPVHAKSRLLDLDQPEGAARSKLASIPEEQPGLAVPANQVIKIGDVPKVALLEGLGVFNGAEKVSAEPQVKEKSPAPGT